MGAHLPEKRPHLIWILRSGLVIFSLALGASFPSAAWADENVPDPSDASSVDQYTEAVPTSGGNVAPGVGKVKRTQLPENAKRALEEVSSATAKTLEEISVSSLYGAPAKSSGKPAKTVTRITDPSVSKALQGSVGAIGGGSVGRLLGLLGVLLATTVGAITAAARKRSF